MIISKCKNNIIIEKTIYNYIKICILSILFIVFSFNYCIGQITRTQIINNAVPYTTYIWTATKANIWNGTSCGGKTIQTPSWVQIGQNSGMPYCWGGWTKTTDIQNYLNNGKSAGDINTDTSFGAEPNCAVGLDCSGLVSRAWGLTNKLGVTGFINISTPITLNQTQPGDILTYIGPKYDHVMLIETNNQNGNYGVIESSSNDWKCSRRSYTAAQLQYYVPRCPNSTILASGETFLPAPILTSPNNNSINQLVTPTFIWQAVTGAVSYRILIATNSAALPNDPTVGTFIGTGGIIDTTTQSTFYIPSINLNNSTTYYWEVHARSANYYGTWSSVWSFTTTPSCTPVSILTHPVSQTVTAGNTATFSVTVSGTSPFTFQWYKNNSSITGATSSSYTTPVLSTSDNGSTYYCYVTNCNGTYNAKSNSATLTVNSSCTPVSILTHPVSQTVTAGNTATFSITVSGTSPFTYQWYKNNASISGATSSSYTTPVLSTSDNGSTYYCYVTNCNGTYNASSTTATLTVTSNTNINCNASTATWQYKANMPDINAGAASVVYGNYLYSIGGMNSNSNNKLFRFDVSNNVWTSLASIPNTFSGIYEGGSVIIGTKIYALHDVNDAMKIYDINSNSWIMGSSRPISAQAPSMATINGYIYVIGGYTNNGATGEVDMYNPTNDSWTIINNPKPTPCYGSLALVYNNEIYLFGGRDKNGNNLRTIEVYNPSTNSWSSKNPMQNESHYFGSGGVINNKIYVIGGQLYTSQYCIEEYDPITDDWKAVSYIPSSLPITFGSAFGVINNKIYIAGGDDANYKPITTTEEITIQQCNSTGINNIYNNQNINIYPNPTTGIINVILSGIFSSDFHVDVYNILGVLLQAKKLNMAETSFNVDLNRYSSGVYLIRIYNRDKIYELKVIKK